MKLIITAGGTSEPIDKVRKITNMSKGTLGKAITEIAESDERVEKIYFLCPTEPTFESEKITWVKTTSVQHVHDTLHTYLTTERIDAVIHAMAVSDYTVDYVCSLEDMVEAIFARASYMNPEDVIEWAKTGEFRLDNTSKISSKSNDLLIKLKPTEKIISKIKEWSPNTLLIGFKLLENVSKEELLTVASALKEKNKCDYVFANDIKKIRDNARHEGHLITPKGNVVDLFELSDIADALVKAVVGDHHV